MFRINQLTEDEVRGLPSHTGGILIPPEIVEWAAGCKVGDAFTIDLGDQKAAALKAVIRKALEAHALAPAYPMMTATSITVIIREGESREARLAKRRTDKARAAEAAAKAKPKAAPGN